MPARFRKLRVFVASPSDVTAERDTLATIVNELNSTLTALAPERHAMIELVRWETHAFPAMGRPQALINDQIGDYDVFVGIMWRRFGTDTGVAGSGTEEEFRQAFDRWQARGAPHVMFYFSNEAMPVPRVDDQVEQIQRVVKFRRDVTARGLVWEYDHAGKFADVVRPHLTSVLGQLLIARTSRSSRRETRQQTNRQKSVVSKSKRQKRRSLTPDLVTPDDVAPIAGVVSIPPGRRLIIHDISRDDAFYDERRELIGQSGVSQGIYPHDAQWWTGKIVVDQPLFVGDDRSYRLLKFKLSLLD